MVKIAAYHPLVLMSQTNWGLAPSSAATGLAMSQRTIGQVRRNGHQPQPGTECPKNATD
jgi:hypothetical protein